MFRKKSYEDKNSEIHLLQNVMINSKKTRKIKHFNKRNIYFSKKKFNRHRKFSYRLKNRSYVKYKFKNKNYITYPSKNKSYVKYKKTIKSYKQLI